MGKEVAKRQIKVLLPSDDHDRVRVAAAISRMSIAEFCRHVVLTEAKRLTKAIKLK